jgi:hypothetical protein
MADFSAADLVTAAKSRFGEKVLREKMRGAESDFEKADIELRKIGAAVISRIQASVGASVGWPLPGEWPDGSVDPDGEDISGTPYSEIWPPLVLEFALWIFNKWAASGYSEIPKNIEMLGTLAEKYLEQVQAGAVGVSIGGTTDVTVPEPLMARDREGISRVAGVPDRDNTLGAFLGGGWDYV